MACPLSDELPVRVIRDLVPLVRLRHAGRRKCMADVVSSDYVRARWAYSELLSIGHGHLYLGEGVPELREKARQKVPFGELGKAEHYLLVDQFDRVRGRYLNRYLESIVVSCFTVTV
jgi:hypothetical protein